MAGFDSGLITSLHGGAASDDIDRIEEALSSGLDVDATRNGITPLTTAARRGNVAAIQYLVSQGATVNPGGHTTPLHAASENGYPNAVEALIEAGADSCRTDSFGLQAFQVAASNGHTKVVRRLERLSSLFCNHVMIQRRLFFHMKYRKDMWLVVRRLGRAHYNTSVLLYKSTKQSKPALELLAPVIEPIEEQSSDEFVCFKLSARATPATTRGKTTSEAKPVRANCPLTLVADRMLYNLLCESLIRDNVVTDTTTESVQESEEETTTPVDAAEERLLVAKIQKLQEQETFLNPPYFCCPITREIMIHPVVAADGHTYEKSSISQWIKRCHRSPKTNSRLLHVNLVPNYLLRSQIREWVDSQMAERGLVVLTEDGKMEEGQASHIRMESTTAAGSCDTSTTNTEASPCTTSAATAMVENKASVEPAGGNEVLVPTTSVAESTSTDAEVQPSGQSPDVRHAPPRVPHPPPSSRNASNGGDNEEDHFEESGAFLTAFREHRKSPKVEQGSPSVVETAAANEDSRKKAHLMSGYVSPMARSKFKRPARKARANRKRQTRSTAQATSEEV
eukprot:gb/GECG01004538.1/.p1 GENE.gb/GECG01004538.1/~~gb/GECG01004538.1/.p1  ORF type:complete len:566 (+),score=71.01 gb/GECG01004538.1/:1-1698(+)